ncbi:MAG: cupin domain-containing protein [Terriglobales bacterium]
MTDAKHARIFLTIVAGVSILLFGFGRVSAEVTADKATVNPAAGAKFGAVSNAPKCFTIAVEKGDPSKGASVILAKFAPRCIAPWHWHTPTETVMVVSGSLEVQMKGDKALVAHRGAFVDMPPRHVHRATCQGAVPCMVFISSDAAFDIHWVDADGKEIPIEAALKSHKDRGNTSKP